MSRYLIYVFFLSSFFASIQSFADFEDVSVDEGDEILIREVCRLEGRVYAIREVVFRGNGSCIFSVISGPRFNLEDRSQELFLKRGTVPVDTLNGILAEIKTFSDWGSNDSTVVDLDLSEGEKSISLMLSLGGNERLFSEKMAIGDGNFDSELSRFLCETITKIFSENMNNQSGTNELRWRIEFLRPEE
jgi:hypothetical protein